MNKADYLNRNAIRKQNGQFTRAALAAMSDALRERVMQLKVAWYTNPAQYGRGLANMPRHAHAGGKRVWHVTNF